jgi:hypothetical protein
MAELDIGKTTTYAETKPQFGVSPKDLDTYGETQGENYWDFEETAQRWGYYKSIPELKKAIDALAIWTIGKGYNTDTGTELILDYLQGWGEDCVNSLLWNMFVTMKVQGDSFAEIVRADNGRLINLKPICPSRVRIVVGKNGLIKRYDIKQRDKNYKPFKKENILHLCNDRVGDEIHGTSVIEVCKWVIDARNEAMHDFRKVLHRNVVPVRIVEVDTDDRLKIQAFQEQYKRAVGSAEVLVIPKGTVSMTADTIKIENPMAWIQYLENFFYQAVGIPRVIATSQDYTEAGSKIGYLTFEPVYTWEQKKLEKDLWNQLGIKLVFNRPPSLKEDVQSGDAKNTGQTGFQPKDTQVNEEGRD